MTDDRRRAFICGGDQLRDGVNRHRSRSMGHFARLDAARSGQTLGEPCPHLVRPSVAHQQANIGIPWSSLALGEQTVKGPSKGLPNLDVPNGRPRLVFHHSTVVLGIVYVSPPPMLHRKPGDPFRLQSTSGLIVPTSAVILRFCEGKARQLRYGCGVSRPRRDLESWTPRRDAV